MYNSAGRPIDPKNIDKHLKAVFAKAELPPMSFHKLRHTAATLMVAAGVELHQVKEQLGHSQISLTANLYAHGLTEAQKKASDTLDRVLREGRLS
jgi:integrase